MEQAPQEMVSAEVSVMFRAKPKMMDGVATYTSGNPVYGRILRIEGGQCLIEQDNRSRAWADIKNLKPSGRGQWVYRPWQRNII